MECNECKEQHCPTEMVYRPKKIGTSWMCLKCANVTKKELRRAAMKRSDMMEHGKSNQESKCQASRVRTHTQECRGAGGALLGLTTSKEENT